MTDPIKAGTPGQIGSVVGVDRMDSIDRAKLDPEVKLQLLCAEAKAEHGRDPRSGGFAIVGRPRAVLQLLLDLKIESNLQSIIRLQRAVIVGADNSDIVGWWCDVPIMVRCTVKDDRLWCVGLDKIPASLSVDRQRAGLMRVAAHNGRLDAIREMEES